MKTMMILGGGAYGTALAMAAARNGHTVKLWLRDEETASIIQRTRRNSLLYPDVVLPDEIEASSDFGKLFSSSSAAGLSCIINTVPTPQLESMLNARGDIKTVLKDKSVEVPLVLTQRGVTEHGEPTFSLLERLEVVPEGKSGERLVHLAGAALPSEMVQGKKTVLVAASENKTHAATVKELLTGSNQLYVQTSGDWLGVVMCGLVRNLVSMYAGYLSLTWSSQNAMCAFLSRVTLELHALMVMLGCDPVTSMGPAGVADMMLHCSCSQSRTFSIGSKIAHGFHPHIVFERFGKNPNMPGAVITTEGIACLVGVYLELDARLSQEQRQQLPVIMGVIDALRFIRRPKELEEWVVDPDRHGYNAVSKEHAPILGQFDVLMENMVTPTPETEDAVEKLKLNSRPAPPAFRDFFSRGKTS
eukprot:PhM_4_TR13140/c0_g1_i1/m.70593/K00057/gpsA; glycerol-3-phosphate dehydrogenase (NAD(P)+)